MNCNIVKDLLPSYVDGLTSQDSNRAVELHLAQCPLCRQAEQRMRTSLQQEPSDGERQKINLFRKLNQRVLRAVLSTLGVCVLIVLCYLYFFGFGWKIDSEKLVQSYSLQGDVIQIDFSLKDKNVLNAFTGKDGSVTFTECFPSFLDDRGTEPGSYSIGIHYRNQDGSRIEFTQEHKVVLQFRDETKTIYWSEVAKELGL